MAQGLIFGSFVIEGMPELLQDIERYGEEIRFKVSAELRATAQQVVREAKRRAPSNMGALRRGINFKTHDDLNYEIISSADYSAFVEWGTKKKVIVPVELANFAQQFHGIKRLQGGTLGFRQAIYEWCRKKGIEKKFWYFIFISIAKRGIRAQPFFFPVILAEGEHAKRRIEYILNTAA